MCKTLFRFEDKYGMHSIVTSFKGITKDASTDFYTVGDIYVQYGLSCIPCLCTADIIDVCSVLGIDRVVLIFDLDGPMRILRNGIQRSVALRYFITLLHGVLRHTLCLNK